MHGTVAVSVTLENERGERMRDKRICFLLFAPCAKIGQVQGVARLALLQCIFESELIGELSIVLKRRRSRWITYEEKTLPPLPYTKTRQMWVQK